MLKTTKTTTISGQSVINDKVIAYYNANINLKDGTTTINSNIQDQKTYDANKAEVRKDLADFTTAVYTEEDNMTADAPATDTPAE